MHYTLEELREKSVVNIIDGVNFGCVDDIVIDSENARVISIVVYGKKKFFGIFGRGPDLLISWTDIKIIGSDVILISVDNLQNSNSFLGNNKKNFINQLFK